MTQVNYSTPYIFRHHSAYFMKVLNPSHEIIREIVAHTLKILSRIFLWFGLSLGLGLGCWLCFGLFGLFVCLFVCLFVETGAHYITQARVKLVILVHRPSKC